ncbi:MAG: YchJ family metal-binding protein [Anaeromyxobacter sp.]
MAPPTDEPCPCGGARYVACCGPRHDGSRPAETAEALMRSRYSAFARCLPDYLLSTHDAPATAAERQAIEAAARSVTWLGLTVHRTEAGGPGDDQGVVEFTARSRDSRYRYTLRERSRFRKVGGRWLYVDGECDVQRSPAG